MTSEVQAHNAATEIPASVVDAWLTAIENLVSVRSPFSNRLFKQLASRTDFTDNQRKRLHRLEPWAIASQGAGTTSSVESGEIPFAVMGYRTPDYREASRNIGDWVQTIAMMSHVVRRPNVSLSGDPQLVRILNRMGDQVPASNRLAGPEGTFRIFEMNRDSSDFDSLPDGTWAFIFGWFMKRPFGKKHPFPLNSSIRPIFVSFHISRPDFLTAEAIDYLRKYGPVGCGDWFTVRLLQKAEVPAYFSGCVTTTVGSLFEKHSMSDEMPTVYVDARTPEELSAPSTLTNLDNSLRNSTLPDGLGKALERLRVYREEYSNVVTSRLHTYLPCKSMGVPVVWAPENPDDRRFNGLAGDSGESLGHMSERISEISRTVLDAILRGESEDEVYSVYREMVAEDVAWTAERNANREAPQAKAASSALNTDSKG